MGRVIGRGRSARVLGVGSTLGLAGVVALGACANGDGTPASLTGPPIGADDGGPPPPSPIAPAFGASVTATAPPPPISGGTLLASKDGKFAIAADADRDAVYVVDLASNTSRTIALKAGDEPGRLVEDGAGRIHVALRSGGAVVTIDPSAATIASRQAVCPAPRGVAYDPSADLVWVACATGELVALPAAGGAASHSFVLERDLRDVIVGSDGSLAVTQFRSAKVLRLNTDGTVARTDSMIAPTNGFLPHVLWRAAAGPSGTLAAVHQEESATSVTTTAQGGYGGCGGGGSSTGGGFGGGSSSGAGGSSSGPLLLADDASGGDDAGPGVADTGAPAAPDLGCGGPSVDGGFFLPPSFPLGIDVAMGGAANFGCFLGGVVRSVFTVIAADGSVLVSRDFAGVLPVDVAVSPDGLTVAAVAPGNAYGPGLPTVFEFSTCGDVTKLATTLGGSSSQPVSVAFAPSGDLLVQTREPARLWVVATSGSETPVQLSDVSRHDTGHDIFHVQAGGMIACASCHPEGRDDGHVWALDGNSRRTPSLSGTIAGTAPYHWPGDMKDLNALVDNVYTIRMSGSALATDQLKVLEHWVQTVPAPPAPSWVDPSAAGRGKALFESASVACATCHSGSKFTNNQTLDVGTGGAFQVPPLVGVGWRTPLLHDGCANTVADRFGSSCSTPGHGHIASLSARDITDLSAYLETL